MVVKEGGVPDERLESALEEIEQVKSLFDRDRHLKEEREKSIEDYVDDDDYMDGVRERALDWVYQEVSDEHGNVYTPWRK